METQMFFKKAKSVKKAVFGRSTWFVRRANKRERKERSGDERRDSSWWRNG